MESVPPRSEILQMLLSKSQIKQKVYDNTFDVFRIIKDVLHELASETNDEISEADADKRAKLEYRDRGQYEAELRIAGDTLIFNMHTNVFRFDRQHSVWQTPYLQSNADNSYCGMISIYNFLADSFKYNRMDDLGYLIGRIFVNKEGHFFVEGKQQLFDYQHFGKTKLEHESIVQIIETAIRYALNFDLLVPPYDIMKTANVAQITNKADDDKIQTGKRIGFEFNLNDVVK
ncbi:hypothetical protein FACS189456_0500 [Bacteroidia bacterium]|nr:hypothetical protein FACS189456_0500 [Bacteroidia bacterium]GHT80625.1 hypothetical protein FACS189467_3230 [Bacteroidia bacterium]